VNAAANRHHRQIATEPGPSRKGRYAESETRQIERMPRSTTRVIWTSAGTIVEYGEVR
jgi:hypothetical protein